jgi:hypothetical protein
MVNCELLMGLGNGSVELLIHGLLAADSQPVSSYPPAYLGILGILGTLAASSPASPAGVFYRRCLLPPVSFTAIHKLTISFPQLK